VGGIGVDASRNKKEGLSACKGMTEGKTVWEEGGSGGEDVEGRGKKTGGYVRSSSPGGRINEEGRVQNKVS